MRSRALVEYSSDSHSASEAEDSKPKGKEPNPAKKEPSLVKRSPVRTTSPQGTKAKGGREPDRKKDQKLLDEEVKRIQKDKDDDEYDRLRLKEDQFLKRQIIEYSKIRIAKRAEEPIDYFAKILFIYKREIKVDEDTNIDLLKHPKKIMDRLGRAEIESLLEKCETFRKIETNEDFQKFWTHIRSLAQSQLDRLIKYELRKKGNINIQSAIGEEYNEEVESMLRGKNAKQLEQLEEQAKRFIQSTDLNLDVEFWDQILSRIQVQKAVMELEALNEKYFEGKGAEDAALAPANKSSQAPQPTSLMIDPPKADPLSPKAYKGELPLNITIFTPENLAKRIESTREKSYKKELAVIVKQAEKEIDIRRTRDLITQGEGTEMEDEELDLEGESRRFKEILRNEENKIEDDELAFDDAEAGQKSTDWIDKFKPRKPHYFNRVKMGYEWNKVNQAHYDLETPPPKQVLGYKFNIFYPNLLNKNQTPRYELVQTDNPEFCIIKFTAGPPYEDLSFKIVHREWDLSDRQGFKCIFERGMLHLHFNFKMIRYRR